MSRRAALTLIVLLAALALPGQALAASANGSAGDMRAYYDGQTLHDQLQARAERR
jgi:hypothetical protein